MSPHFSDEAFRRASEWYLLLSVRAAAEETYGQASWRPVAEVQEMLTLALQRRGIDPEPEAVRRGAELIGRGRKPAVMASEVLQRGQGQRRT